MTYDCGRRGGGSQTGRQTPPSGRPCNPRPNRGYKITLPFLGQGDLWRQRCCALPAGTVGRGDAEIYSYGAAAVSRSVIGACVADIVRALHQVVGKFIDVVLVGICLVTQFVEGREACPDLLTFRTASVKRRQGSVGLLRQRENHCCGYDGHSHSQDKILFHDRISSSG